MVITPRNYCIQLRHRHSREKHCEKCNNRQERLFKKVKLLNRSLLISGIPIEYISRLAISNDIIVININIKRKKISSVGMN